MHRFIPIEAFEDRALRMLRDASACIRHIYPQIHLPIPYPHLDAATGRGVLYRIIQNVKQCFGSPAAVMGYCQIRWAVHRQADLFLFHRSQNTIDGAHQRIPDHSILFLQRNDTRFQTGGFHHSLNEKIQFIQLRACGLQKLLALFFCQWPCQHRIVDQLQICDGGFGLVGNI